MVEDIVREVLVSWVLCSMPSFYSTLWLLKEVCITDGGSLLWSVRCSEGNSCIYNESLPVVLEGMGSFCTQEGI